MIKHGGCGSSKGPGLWWMEGLACRCGFVAEFDHSTYGRQKGTWMAPRVDECSSDFG